MATTKGSKQDLYVAETLGQLRGELGGLKNEVSGIKTDVSQFRAFSDSQFQEIKVAIAPLRKRVYIGTGVMLALACLLQYALFPVLVKKLTEKTLVNEGLSRTHITWVDNDARN